MDHGETGFEGGVEGVGGGAAGFGIAVADEGFGVFDVDVAEVGVPVLVGDGGGGGEFAVSEGLIDFFSGDRHLVEDPVLSQGFMAGLCGCWFWSEGGAECS